MKYTVPKKWTGAKDRHQEGLNSAYETMLKVNESIYNEFISKGVEPELAALVLSRGVQLNTVPHVGG
jgi:hypothetical protein